MSTICEFANDVILSTEMHGETGTRVTVSLSVHGRMAGYGSIELPDGIPVEALQELQTEIANAIATATACIPRIEQKRNHCTVCGTLIDPLAEFPGTRCLDCYAVSADGNRHISARELAQMWGAR